MNFLFAIALLVASYLIQSLIATQPEKPKPASLGEFDLPQTKEGTPECVIFGDCWIPDWTVLWYGNLRNSPVKSSGSKK
jgi:hypothetical protein